MASKKALIFEIFGRDRTASKTMRGVGTTAERMGDKMRKVGALIAVGLAAAVGSAVAFGVSSVKAYAEAEESQNKLAFSLAKFPALADTNLKALQKLNTALQKKTRFDDDAIAAGQAVLGQYKITGKQLEKLTPLLLDYAARTGKDLPTAAEDLGKALLGQGRALKEIGVKFTDTGSVAGNFDQLVQDLSASVGGFAEKDATTAIGRLDILKNRFGEVQEKIGLALLPALEDLMAFFDSDLMPGVEGLASWITDTGIPALRSTWEWIVKWKDVLGPTAIALGTLTVAQWLLNVAMDANPVGLVIIGLGLLIAAAAVLVTNWESVTRVVMTTTGGIQKAILDIALGVANGVQGTINALLGGINTVLPAINGILKMLGLATIKIPVSVDFTSGLRNFASTYKSAIDSSVNGSAGSRGAGISTPAGSGGGKKSLGGSFAEGGIVRARPGGIFAQIGEGKYNEAVIPLSPAVLAQMGGGGGKQSTVNFNITNPDPTVVTQAIMQRLRGKLVTA